MCLEYFIGGLHRDTFIEKRQLLYETSPDHRIGLVEPELDGLSKGSRLICMGLQQLGQLGGVRGASLSTLKTLLDCVDGLGRDVYLASVFVQYIRR